MDQSDTGCIFHLELICKGYFIEIPHYQEPQIFRIVYPFNQHYYLLVFISIAMHL